MPFKMTIESDQSISLSRCIEAVEFRIDSPNGSNARSTDVGNTIEIHGRIGNEDPTPDLYLWSLLPANDAKVYRKLTVKIIGHLGITSRKVCFPNAFVVDYAESHTSHDGNGSFYLMVKQKKDRNDAITVNGGTEEDDDDEAGDDE